VLDSECTYALVVDDLNDNRGPSQTSVDVPREGFEDIAHFPAYGLGFENKTTRPSSTDRQLLAC
jgi:hypothetical protein